MDRKGLFKYDPNIFGLKFPS